VRLAPEGYRLIAIAGIATVLALLYGARPLALVGLVLTLLLVNFFRDPERLTPPGDHLVTSPADGRVVAVLEDVREERFLKRAGLRRVSIFMSPLDVHVNRVPVDGTVVEVRHRPGRFHAAYLDKSSELNEQNAVVVEDPRGERVLFVQIAGQLARRIVCRLRPGDRVRRGERYGMIMLGSRLDLYLPPQVALSVRPGDRVQAGTSVIGAYP
jgi:phosphatidylserine decarboxylase